MPSNEPQTCCAAQKQCCKSVDSNNTTTTTAIAKSCSNGTKCCRNETPAYKPVTNVIFDLDGLLIDSEVRFANAIAILLKRYGVPEYSKELQEKVLGMEVARGIEEIIRVTGIPLTVAEFMVKEREIYMEEMLNVQLMPGVTRLVQHLRKHRIPMAIATGSTKESYEIKVRNHQQVFEAGRYFDHIVFTRDDPEVKRPKPAPDVYLITANRWKNIVPSPDKCLVFEDSSIGVDGAIAAGMQCVMIPDTRFPRKQPNATLILTTLEHFKPELFGLPPFDE